MSDEVIEQNDEEIEGVESVEESSEEELDNENESEEETEGDDGNDTDTDEEEDEFEFEYDDEGNIIIPDDEDEDEDETESDGDEEAEEDEEQKPTDTKKPTETAEEKKTEGEDTIEAKYAALEAKYKALEKQAKEAVKKMGVEDEDVLEALIQVTAESSGVTKEEYKSQLSAEEAIRAADLKAIQAVFPHAAEYKSIYDLPNIGRFGELRVKGATPIEAYRATHSDIIASKVAAKSKGGKEHLKSLPATKKSGTATRITAKDMAWLRSEFPNKTDKERIKLYKSTL